MPNNQNMVTSAHDLAALIQWYEAAGADCALADDPQDRFAETKNQLAARQTARANTPQRSGSPSSNQHAPGYGADPVIHPQQPGSLPHAPQSPPWDDQGQNAGGQQGAGSAFQTPISTFTSKSMEDQSHPPTRLGETDQTFGVNQPQMGQSPHPAHHPAMAPGGMMSRAGGQVEEARQRAISAKTLEELEANLASFDGCSLKFSAKNLVFGDGNPEADLMFIGEAPGRDEDMQGLPFVGRAGQLLDKMMAAIERDRTNSYITNILPWRPPGNRKPSLDESEMMRPFIHRHIELVNPKVLIFLGGTAAQQLLGTKEGIMRLRGRWKAYPTAQGDIPAMATLHPAFLLRTPAQKRAAWQDLLEVAAKVSGSSKV
ncbi:MAG: uracil-DNA glycosylase [Cohaesibacter sp.]|nr:uracil-DNA glycosylase [Cohaesibacter sp.]